jgi:uroporphyrin-III C-methyltransferase/precorrin-2 dehydrogenase/sirohydrochlorin ferrochelatase
MDYLPVFLDIRDRLILVDGGGTLAARRVQRALSAGARVMAFDPQPGPELLAMSDDSNLTIVSRRPTQNDVVGCTVVYGASEDRNRDERLYGWSRTANVLCNIADWPAKCDFITPSIVDRSPIVIAISSGGAAPVIARILRARIETIVPNAFGQLARFTGAFRDRIAAVISHGRDRRRFWERMIDGPAGDLFLSGNPAQAQKQIIGDLARHAGATDHQDGEVYLVGAGPGDPDLLTFRALRLMQRCDVVLHDHLIGEDILPLVRRDAKRIPINPPPDNQKVPQEGISELLVSLAKQGNRVLLLRAGDPFNFGQGGDDIKALTENEIAFQVVPGITEAAGGGSYAGIPLTHKDHAQTCAFVALTGSASTPDWGSLIHPGQTVAVQLDLSNLPVMVGGARDHRVDMSTPVSVIINGTRLNQMVLTGTLADIQQKAYDAQITGPATIIVGSVVTLRDRLNWTAADDSGQAMALSSATSAFALAAE